MVVNVNRSFQQNAGRACRAADVQVLRSLVPSDETITALCGLCERLNKLRNAAAHGDYETLRDQRFTELATFFDSDSTTREAPDRETLLQEVAKFSFWISRSAAK
jgi:hypothetical protein